MVPTFALADTITGMIRREISAYLCLVRPSIGMAILFGRPVPSVAGTPFVPTSLGDRGIACVDVAAALGLIVNGQTLLCAPCLPPRNRLRAYWRPLAAKAPNSQVAVAWLRPGSHAGRVGQSALRPFLGCALCLLVIAGLWWQARHGNAFEMQTIRRAWSEIGNRHRARGRLT